MKTIKTLLMGVVATAALTANQNLQAAYFSPSDLNNRAVVASPRAKEQFPWLKVQGAPHNSFTQRGDRVPAAIKNNRAFANSPRVIEQYPELARTSEPSATASPNSGTENPSLSLVLKNRALAHSPRMLEQFPQLRATSLPANETLIVAPVK